jgi:hypothetical protein
MFVIVAAFSLAAPSLLITLNRPVTPPS